MQDLVRLSSAPFALPIVYLERDEHPLERDHSIDFLAYCHLWQSVLLPENDTDNALACCWQRLPS